MSATAYLEESLQRDIGRIRQRVVAMEAMVTNSLRKSIRAFVEENRALAYAVILRDPQIDEMEKEIDRLCLEFLVRQQPVATHLRFAYAAIKINAELERIGDYAESIAKQVLKLTSMESKISADRFVEMANLSIPMVGDAIRAFIDQNVELAAATMEVEGKVNQIRDDVNVELLHAEKDGRISLEAMTPLTTIARRIERVSDQAKNICEEVLYMCTGEYMKHKGTEMLRILFVDEHNACQSVLAEAIGNSLSQSKILFNSAGLTPQPIDPQTVSFLRENGLDGSRHISKTIQQIPNLEHYQVIVALDAKARGVFPQPPDKTVTLDWELKDPSQVKDTPEVVRAAYEEAYQFLRKQISSLTEAILDEEKKPLTQQEQS